MDGLIPTINSPSQMSTSSHCLPPNNDNNQHHIGNNMISTLSAVSDLGFIISSNLKWHKHICNIFSKASIHCYQILHCLNSNNVWILLKTYITYIRQLLQYNTVL